MFKKFIAIALSFIMFLTFMPLDAFAQTTNFSDMPEDWSTQALENAVKNGLLNGADGKIMPKENLTRA
ncbi:MAG: S-layer homology domain-containing protein [Bacillota bacterium]|nr:S-layer homology domain-containing protein [Bacillota bacterium]